jgi:outer membrane protein assembly factor BamD (BamD/ComL family)
MENRGLAKKSILGFPFYFLLPFILLLSIPTAAQRPDINKLRQWEAEGDTLMSLQQYEEAVKVFTRIVDGTGLKERQDYNALYKRAISYYYIEGKEDLALADVDLFIKQFPQVPQSHILRAFIALKMIQKSS